jgi:hypothetical protein
MQTDWIAYECNVCHSEGDFADENDAIYDEAMKEFSKKAMATMLQKLSAKGVSLAYFERSLRLPQRTTQRWKNDGGSAAATTLTKFVLLMPWLLEVADGRFEENKTNAILAREGIQAASNLMRAPLAQSTPSFYWKTFQADRVEILAQHKIEPKEPNCIYNFGTSSYPFAEVAEKGTVYA